jgi:hypothetical protein
VWDIPQQLGKYPNLAGENAYFFACRKTAIPTYVDGKGIARNKSD